MKAKCIKSKRIFCSLILLGMSINTYAYQKFSWQDKELNFYRSNEGKIVLSGDCNKVGLYLQKIKNWTKKLNENNKIKFPEYKVIKSNNNRTLECHAAIDDVLPQHIVNNFYKKSTTSYGGPNCWNSALFSTKILKYLRYTTQSEVSFYMNSPLCRKLKFNEHPKIGDIVLNRSDGLLDELLFDDKPTSNSPERHGYIYISNSLIIEKAGHQNNSYLKLTSAKDSHKSYGTYPWYHFECKKPKDKRPFYCNYWADFYRCNQNMDQFIANNHTQIHKGYLKLRKNIMDIERVISISHYDKDSQFDHLLEMIIDLEKVNFEHESRVKSVNQLKKRKIQTFLINEIRIKIEALKKNIRFLEKQKALR